MDLQVLKAQQYLNTTYGSNPGFVKVPESGQTGWPTIFGIIRGLQVELGITSLSSNFGTGTAAAFTNKFGTLSSGNSTKKVTALVQCAFWCKGYYGGPTFGEWTDTIDGGIQMIRKALGLTIDSTITLKLMRSLLSMDAYVLVSGGTDYIRAGQQWLNGRYLDRRDFDVLPTDGLFTRSVQEGFVLALQFELGMADYSETNGTGATGSLGPKTLGMIQNQATVRTGDNDSSKRFVTLFQIALAFNGYPVSITGNFDAATSSAVNEFQSFMEQAKTGLGDYQTWAGLLVSTGDPNQPATGMDTNRPITAEKARSLYSSGYRVAARYLTVPGKAFAPGEIEVLLGTGFSIVPIFQNYNDAASYFTKETGLDHGLQAAIRARQLGFKQNTIIFFAVDYDAFGDEILTIIAEYFRGIKESISKSRSMLYKIGVYATRNVCQKLRDNGFVDAIWVSGMSTGYSGNLGFRMPQGWMYNQIQEIKSINIDRNVVSVRATPASRNDISPTPLTPDGNFDSFYWAIAKQAFLSEGATLPYQTLVSSIDASINVLFGFQVGTYDSGPWRFYTPYQETLPAMPQQLAQAYALTRGAYFKIADPVSSIKGYEGDLPHMAATANGVVQWGNAQGESAIAIGDLGGWGLDFIQLWASYRISGNGMSINDFVLKYLGAPGAESDSMGFGQADLIADVDGWLIGSDIGKGVPIDESVRQLFTDYRSWNSRLKLFIERRFGSDPATLENAIISVFAESWPWPNFPRDSFIKGQRNATPAEAIEFAKASVTRLTALTKIGVK